MQSKLQVVPRLMPKDDFLRTGVCFKDRPAGGSVDTIIIHSCYLPDSVIQVDLNRFGITATEESARSLANKWKELVNQASLPENLGQKQDLQAQAIANEYAAIKALIVARHDQTELHTFSISAITTVFEFYGVSAHYVISRDGNIIELVPPESLAFHAGPSKMPLSEDARTGVSAFSIGIELLTSETMPVTEAQYSALKALVSDLRAKFPINNFYGHSDIAPGRKTDPWNFDWKRFSEDQKLDISRHHFPTLFTE